MSKWVNRVVGGSKQATPAVPISDYDKSASFLNLLQAGFIDDDTHKRMDFFARKRFPDDPSALERYQVINDKIAYKADDGNLYYEIPEGGGIGNILKSATYGSADALAASPAIATGIATAPAMLTGPAGMAYSIGATGLAALGGQTAREVTGNLLADDPVNVSRITTNTALDMAGQGIAGALGKRAANKTLVSKYSDGNLMANAPKDDSLFTAGQKLDNAALIQKESFARTHPASANIMSEADNARAGWLDSRVQTFLDDIAPPVGLAEAGQIAKETTEKAAEITANKMARKARPFYEAAFASNTQVNTQSVIDEIIERVQSTDGAKGKLSGLYKRVYSLFHVDDVPITSVRGLHHIKKELDDMLTKGPLSSMGKEGKSFVQGVKSSLLKQMDTASPDYKKARQIYIDLYPDRETAGQVNSVIANIKDQKLHKIAQGLLGDANEVAIGKARDVFSIADPSGEAWSKVVRAYLEKNFIEASTQYATSNPNLRHGKFMHKVFGDTFKKQNIKQALTPVQYKGLTQLMDMLEKSAKGLVTNSATAGRQAIEEEMTRQNKNLIVKATEFDLTQPGKILFQTAKNLSDGKGWREFAEATTDPQNMQRLAELAGVKPSSLRAKALASQILAFGVSESLPTDQPQNLLTEL